MSEQGIDIHKLIKAAEFTIERGGPMYIDPHVVKSLALLAGQVRESLLDNLALHQHENGRLRPLFDAYQKLTLGDQS